jgi:hypothetical protein
MYTLNSITSNSVQSLSSSTLSKSDQNLIEFTRCLYKAKSVVQELQIFSTTVGPTLYLPNSIKHEIQINANDFTRHIKIYLDESIHKFNQLCKVLLVVLSTLESNQSVKRERIDSFRQELVDEWRKATNIKQDLLKLIQYNDMKNEIQSIKTSVNITDKMTLSIDSYDENDGFITSSSETTPEPTSDS